MNKFLETAYPKSLEFHQHLDLVLDFLQDGKQPLNVLQYLRGKFGFEADMDEPGRKERLHSYFTHILNRLENDGMIRQLTGGDQVMLAKNCHCTDYYVSQWEREIDQRKILEAKEREIAELRRFQQESLHRSIFKMKHWWLFLLMSVLISFEMLKLLEWLL